MVFALNKVLHSCDIQAGGAGMCITFAVWNVQHRDSSDINIPPVLECRYCRDIPTGGGMCQHARYPGIGPDIPPPYARVAAAADAGVA